MVVLGAGASSAAGSVLVRYQTSTRSAATVVASTGLPFDGILGILLDTAGSGRVAVYECPDISGDMTLATQACSSDGVDQSGAQAGFLYASAPVNVTATVALYACPPAAAGLHAVPTVSRQQDCEHPSGSSGTFLGFALLPVGTLNRWLFMGPNNLVGEWDTTGAVLLENASRVIALGYPLTTAGANRSALYSCANASGDYMLVAAPANCGTAGARGEGWIFATRPAAPATVPLYRCLSNGIHSASVQTTCPGTNTGGTLLGFLPITTAAPPPPPPPPDTDHDGIPDPADHCPARAAGRYDRDHDGCAGPYRRMHIRDSVRWAIPRRGVQLTKLVLENVPHGATVVLKCPSCHITERRRAGGTKGTKNVRLRRILRHTLLPRHGYTIAVTAPGYIGVLLRITALPHGPSDRARARANNHPLARDTRCLPVGSSRPARHCTTRPT